MPAWLSKTTQGWQLRLHIQPGARQCGCVGEYGVALKIKISAPPADGKANQALLDWLRHQLKLPARSIALVSGQSSRQKVVLVLTSSGESLTQDQIISRLLGDSTNE